VDNSIACGQLGGYVGEIWFGGGAAVKVVDHRRWGRRLGVVRELPEELVLPEEMAPATLPGGPATPRDAATVMLIRDSGDGIEVFLLRRVVGMAFAGGMTVFPGGGVDPRDADSSVAWVGPEPEWWAERFGCSASLARALVCAAVRETFEESGVLLAADGTGAIIADTTPFAAARQALVDREFSLAEFLTDNGLVLRADLLRPWANWVTPAEEPHRYDTRFFLAELPAGQRADGATSEADHVSWRRPDDAVEDWKTGRCGLLPPTWMALADLAEFRTVAAATSADRTIEKVIPKVIRDGTVLRVVLPGDPRFEAAAGHLDARPDDRLERP
jgi:8-oxo-dGTP pyrophosphatase MutT (NUDIX family)